MQTGRQAQRGAVTVNDDTVQSFQVDHALGSVIGILAVLVALPADNVHALGNAEHAAASLGERLRRRAERGGVVAGAVALGTEIADIENLGAVRDERLP